MESIPFLLIEQTQPEPFLFNGHSKSMNGAQATASERTLL